MKFFIDTANLEEIKEANSWGILDGVTTNPTHLSKETKRYWDLVEEICKAVKGPVSVEVVSLGAEEMLEEAKRLVKIADNIVIKVPSIQEGVKATKMMAEEGIKTNFTLVFSPLQALLAAKAGATYVSPFIGRLDAVGHYGMELVEQIRSIYDNYDFQTEIIVAAVRHPGHILDAALMGADITTMRFEIMQQLFKHPLTDTGLKQFLKDWNKVPK